MFSITELFSIDGVSQSSKTKFDKFIEGEERFHFNYFCILPWDDETSIKFRTSQETVK